MELIKYSFVLYLQRGRYNVSCVKGINKKLIISTFLELTTSYSKVLSNSITPLTTPAKLTILYTSISLHYSTCNRCPPFSGEPTHNGSHPNASFDVTFQKLSYMDFYGVRRILLNLEYLYFCYGYVEFQRFVEKSWLFVTQLG